MKKALSYFCALLFFAVNLSAFADPPPSIPPGQHPGAIAMTADAVLMRPLLLAATIGGAVVFIATLPFSAMGGNVHQAGEALVGVPANATFKRCLGCDTTDGTDASAVSY